MSIAGTDPTSRDQHHRLRRERYAMRSGIPELHRKDLRSERFTIVHEPTGDEFKIYAGEVDAAIGTNLPVAAFFYDATGAVVLLERMPQ